MFTTGKALDRHHQTTGAGGSFQISDYSFFFFFCKISKEIMRVNDEETKTSAALKKPRHLKTLGS